MDVLRAVLPIGRSVKGAFDTMLTLVLVTVGPVQPEVSTAVVLTRKLDGQAAVRFLHVTVTEVPVMTADKKK